MWGEYRLLTLPLWVVGLDLSPGIRKMSFDTRTLIRNSNLNSKIHKQTTNNKQTKQKPQSHKTVGKTQFKHN